MSSQLEAKTLEQHTWGLFYISESLEKMFLSRLSIEINSCLIKIFNPCSSCKIRNE